MHNQFPFLGVKDWVRESGGWCGEGTHPPKEILFEMEEKRGARAARTTVYQWRVETAHRCRLASDGGGLELSCLAR